MKSGNAETRLRPIYLDNHLLAVAKPSGLPSQPDASGDPSLIELAKDYVRLELAKPGEVHLSLLHRLDRPTSGLVLLARTGKAAKRLSEAFRKREVKKTYLAIVEGLAASRKGGECRDWLAQAGNGNMRPVAAGFPGAREARLSYRVLSVDADRGRSLLEVNLLTGVKHQIRCQLAQIGLPVAGDFRYGSGGRPARPTPVSGGRAVLLHAWRITFTHPTRREPLELSAPPPEHWRDYLSGFPGASSLMLTLRA
ncbi:MAG: RNA pseudouridine synthase [Planctomycetota bacterium]|jgi:23S rRNA pseudouridine1911/1915/1917 synthase|nr:RNA pseudouridine synthase [Planctomycetota bacterium]